MRIVDGIVVDLATCGICIGCVDINATAAVVFDTVIVADVVTDDVVCQGTSTGKLAQEVPRTVIIV